MTPEEVRAIATAGETLTVEFKRGTRNHLNDDVIVETVVSLANGQGGVIFLGVEDDGRITGLAPRHGARTEPHLMQAMILNKTDAPVATEVEVPEQANQLTLGAILLFGTSDALARLVPTAEVVFHELSKSAITADETLRHPLFRSAERLYDLIDVRNSEQEVMIGLHRIGVPRVPEGTIRESIANALVHRDYSEMGPIAVQLTEDYFRVSSPGGFPPGITLANLLEDSKPRSPILAEAFKRAGIVDRAGRGISQMYQQLLRAGRGEPDYTTTNERAVIVTIATSDADLEMVRFVVEYEDSTGSVLSLHQLRILHELKVMGPQATTELVESLRESTGLTRTQLARLAEMGLVEPRGSGRNRRHHLTAAFYRLAQSSEYVRLQDYDPIQQEHMVLTYVDQFGAITRGKAAELCRLSPDQARTVLRRLVDAGELEMRGERRGATYVRRRM